MGTDVKQPQLTGQLKAIEELLSQNYDLAESIRTRVGRISYIRYEPQEAAKELNVNKEPETVSETLDQIIRVLRTLGTVQNDTLRTLTEII